MNAIATINTADFAADFADLRADLVRAHLLAETIRVSTSTQQVSFTMAFVAPRIAQIFGDTFERTTRLAVQRNAVEPIADYDTCGADLESLQSLIEVCMEAAHWLTVDAGMDAEVTLGLQYVLSRTKRALTEHDAAHTAR